MSLIDAVINTDYVQLAWLGVQAYLLLDGAIGIYHNAEVGTHSETPRDFISIGPISYLCKRLNLSSDC